jgi:flavoprotein, HI0933 family
MYDCIIIGAGPAGLMASIALGPNKKVLIIEKNESAGKKLLITGGGRCNVTNLKSNNDFLNEIEYNKKYLYSAINTFGPYDIYNFFESNGVLLKEEEDNKIFPVSNKSKDILEILIRNINAEINYNEEVIGISSGEVVTNKNVYKTKNIIVSTGGTSFKNTGSTGDHIGFAEMLKQPIIPLYPAEVGIILNNQPDLAGTSIENVEIKYLNIISTGNLMFTHKGLSGSSIMKLSEHIYKNDNKEIVIDLLPDLSKEELIDIINNYDREKEVVTLLNEYFSKRFSSYLTNKLNINKKIKSLSKVEIDNIIDILKSLAFNVKATENIDKAYVTGGGIDLKYINSSTMESTINKGIYFVGESLDIHGPIGGYNITLALSTGYLAGIKIKNNI